MSPLVGRRERGRVDKKNTQVKIKMTKGHDCKSTLKCQIGKQENGTGNE